MRSTTILLLLLMGVANGMAQDDFNPDSPPEPNLQLTVSMSCSPEGAGETSFSWGEGLYVQGDEVTVVTASNDPERYAFLHWTQDGEIVSEDPEYTFTVGDHDIELVAVYQDLYPFIVSMSCSPEEAGNTWFSSGDGHYPTGYELTVNTESNNPERYKFQYWTQDGEIVCEEAAYTFTVESDMELLAVYLDEKDPDEPFNPENPAEPDMPDMPEIGPFLYLETNIEGAGWFDFESGNAVEAGSVVDITAYPNDDYTFLGWYYGEELLSDNNTLSFEMPENDVWLMASFEYTPAPEPPFDPENPIEPGDVVVNDGSILHWGYDLPWKMKYVYQEVDEGVPPAEDWYATDFDDTGWEVLKGPVDRSGCEHFGLGEGNFYNMVQEYSCLYLRRSFEIENYEEFPNLLVLNLSVDDVAEVYLNGEFVGTNRDQSFEYCINIPKSKFVAGTNLLAIYYHDEAGEAYLDYQLTEGDLLSISPYVDGQGVEYTLNEDKTAWTVTAMNWDESMTSIGIPGTLFDVPVTTIGSGVFNGHNYISEITLNEGFTTIETLAFYGTGISSIVIPASVAEIQTYADAPANPFGNCPNLSSITVAEDNNVYCSPEGSNAIIEEASHTLVVGCKQTLIPNTVTKIGDAAFHDLESLTRITIPESVTEIGEGAFWNVSQLRTVTVEFTNPLDITSKSYDPFEGTPKNILYVPVGCKELFQEAEGWNQFAYILEIGEEDPETVILKDGEPYENWDYTYATKVKYIRSFSNKVTGNYQCWYVPFDYTVKEEDKDNFQFYKIHMIAGKSEPGEAETLSSIFIYIVKVLEGETLRGNRPYVVTPLKVFTDHVFISDDVELMPVDESSRLHLETAETAFDFYGIYSNFKPTSSKECMTLNTDGKISWVSTNATLKPYRWRMIPSSKEDMIDYSNSTFTIIEEDDDLLNINTPENETSEEITHIYSSNGIQQQSLVKGLNIVKMKDGRSKKIFIK